MKVSGDATLSGPLDDVWTALRDPQVLVRTIPGCQRLETVGEQEYEMTVTAGVASIKGTYLGTVRLTDPDPPRSFVLRASGAGNPGTVDASVTVSLAGEDGGTTRLQYDADAAVGGTIAGVGQRMLSSAARRTAQEFFTNVDAVLTEGLAEAAPGPAAEPATEATAAETAATATPEAGPGDARPRAAAVFESPHPSGRTHAAAGDFVKGVAFGAAIALAGVAVGGLLGRRTGPSRPGSPRVLSPEVEIRPPTRRGRSS